MTVPLTDIERRMLDLLDFSAPTRPGFLGSCLWGRSAHRMPQHYARPAGRVLNGLRKKKLVTYVASKDAWGWIKLRAA